MSSDERERWSISVLSRHSFIVLSVKNGEAINFPERQDMRKKITSPTQEMDCVLQIPVGGVREGSSEAWPWHLHTNH